MGEIAINPIHNVHKKYRTMNFVNPYIFAPPVDLSTNTEIGGVASTISTPALLATKLGILESRITNFAIIGSDIKCRITGGTYDIATNAFSSYLITPYLTYYNDTDSLVRTLNRDCFYAQTTFTNFALNGVTSLFDYQSFYRTGVKNYYLPSLTAINEYDNFRECSNSEVIYIPNCTKIGASHSVNNNNFTSIKTGTYIYAHPSMATINSGGVEADLAAAITAGNTVRYVNNFTSPLTPSITSIGAVYSTAIQLVDAGGSTNAIDYFEVTVNGIDKGKIFAGAHITGLTPSTTYNITLKAVDVFYNKSAISANLSVNTNTTSAVPTTGLVSYYKLDETTGTIANDSFGTQHLTNSGVSINQSGKAGTAYLDVAANQNLSTTAATSLTSNFSINSWLYRTASPSGANNVIIEQGDYRAGFGLWINPSSQLGWFINTNYLNYSAYVLPLNTWVMVTLVYNGTNVKLYADGVLKNTTANTTNPGATTNRRFFNRISNSEAYIGKIDEAAIYNAALTQSQIDVLYNLGTGITL